MSLGYYDESYPPSLWGGGVIPDPSIASIAPTTAVAGSGQKVITVTGSNFQSDSVVEIDQVAQPTTYVSETSLTATYTPTVAGAKVVTVRNGGSGGEESNSVTFTVTATELGDDIGAETAGSKTGTFKATPVATEGPGGAPTSPVEPREGPEGAVGPSGTPEPPTSPRGPRR